MIRMLEEGKEEEVRVRSQDLKNREEGGESHLLPMHQQQQQHFNLDVREEEEDEEEEVRR